MLGYYKTKQKDCEHKFKKDFSFFKYFNSDKKVTHLYCPECGTRWYPEDFNKSTTNIKTWSAKEWKEYINKCEEEKNMKLNCKVEICKYNEHEKCSLEEICLDYYGYDAKPTCMGFERKEIKEDVFVSYDEEPGGNVPYDEEPGGNVPYDEEP